MEINRRTFTVWGVSFSGRAIIDNYRLVDMSKRQQLFAEPRGIRENFYSVIINRYLTSALGSPRVLACVRNKKFAYNIITTVTFCVSSYGAICSDNRHDAGMYRDISQMAIATQ